MQYSETFQAAGARTAATLQADGSTTNATGSSSSFGGGVSLAYDAATQAYTIRDAGGTSATFLASSRNAGASNSNVTVYDQATAGGTDRLVLFNPGAGNQVMQLSYVSFGAWRRSIGQGATADVSFQYFVYGIRQGANQPSTGSASYATHVEGIWNNADGIYLLSGTSDFTANFTNMTVSTTLQLDGTNGSVAGGGVKSLGRFDGTGTIAALGGGFNGTLVHRGTDQNGNVFNGSFAGAFFGPQGQEVGYTFSLTSPGGGTAAGAVVGKAN